MIPAAGGEGVKGLAKFVVADGRAARIALLPRGVNVARAGREVRAFHQDRQAASEARGSGVVVCLAADSRAYGTDVGAYEVCLLYTSPSPRDGLLSRMPSS